MKFGAGFNYPYKGTKHCLNISFTSSEHCSRRALVINDSKKSSSANSFLTVMQKKIFVEKAQLKKQSQVRACLVYVAYEALVVLIKYTVDPIALFCFDCLFVCFLFFKLENRYTLRV